MKKPKRLVYVIQKHRSSHLHYDLRLEANGVLKSWAIPKKPPLEKGIKRLAINVANHKLGYEKFKGKIPKGQYGAGEVEIWDRGYYKPVSAKKNSIIADIHGKRLKGTYCLVRFKPKSKKDKNKNWIFFKK